MTKYIISLLVTMLVFISCNNDDNIYEMLDAKKGPVVTFDKTPFFFIDTAVIESAIFEAIIEDTENNVARYELSVTYMDKLGQVFNHDEPFRVIENFPHNLRVSLTELAEIFKLDVNEIVIGETFRFNTMILGKDGVLYNGSNNNLSGFDAARVYDEDGETVITVLDRGWIKDGGDYDPEFNEIPSYKGAMSFDIVTFLSPPPIYRFTSFEEPPTPIENQYCRDGMPKDNEVFVNHPQFGEPFVQWTAVGDGPEHEIGFSTEYIDLEGDDEGDGFSCETIGVISDAERAKQWTHGSKGFGIEDADGMIKVTFDRVEIPAEHELTGIRIDTYINNTGYEDEPADRGHIYVEVEKHEGGSETIDLLDADDDMLEELGDEEKWKTLDTGLLEGVKSYQLFVEWTTNSSSEYIKLDYLIVYLPRSVE